MIEIKVTQKRKRNIKTIFISAKCADLCVVQLRDENGDVIVDHDGYVPPFIPGEYGDYVDIHIDVETGKILNWVKPTAEEIEDWMGENEITDGMGDEEV